MEGESKIDRSFLEDHLAMCVKSLKNVQTFDSVISRLETYPKENSPVMCRDDTGKDIVADQFTGVKFTHDLNAQQWGAA